MTWLRASVLVCFCLLWVLPAHAADLSRAEVEGFIEAFEEIRVEAEAYEDEAEEYRRESGRTFTSFSDAVEIMRAVGFDEIDDIAEDHGFADGADWGRVGDRVMAAYMAIQMGDAGGGQDMAETMAQMRQMLEEDPNMTEEQKAALLAQMEDAMAQAEAAMAGMPETSQADRDLVREYVPQLEAAMDAGS